MSSNVNSDKSSMKTVRVVAAIIQRDGKFFATQRKGGEFDGMWEFPGGKIEPGETPRQALHREIAEELEVAIEIISPVMTIEYDYPSFHLSMECYLCALAADTAPHLNVHTAGRWITCDEAASMSFLPADDELIATLAKISSSR